jgi:tetratricopeptide (TPR) repeat protein
MRNLAIAMSVAVAASLGSCSTTGIRVPVLEPAPVNLVQYERVAVDRFHGDGCDPLTDQLAEALRTTPNPTTGKASFQVLSRKDIDKALDELRDRHGDEWDRRTMEVLERWRTAQIVLTGAVEQNRVQDQVVEQHTVDPKGRQICWRERHCSAEVRACLQLNDVDGKVVFDRAVLQGCAAAQTRGDGGEPACIEHEPLLAQARAQIVQQYLARVLPHQVWLQVDLYTDGSFPDLQVGNGYAETGNWQQAAESYQRALDAMTGANGAPRYKGLFNLGVACEFTDRFAEARKSLQDAYAQGQDRMILQELQRVDRREQDVRRLREQAAKPAQPPTPAPAR